MNITIKQLKTLGACEAGIVWFRKHKVRKLSPLITALLKNGHFDYARWLLVRLMTHPQQIQWAVTSAKSVLEIFEQKYPADKRPRQAIEAAEKWGLDPTPENRVAAYAAAYAAYAANAAAYAAANAANAAAYVANAAANAAYAAYPAADAAANAAYAAYAAADAADAAANAAYAAYAAVNAAYPANVAADAAYAAANAARKRAERQICDSALRLLGEFV